MRVALRQNALYLPDVKPVATMSESTAALVDKLRRIGFTMTERLLHAFNAMPYGAQREVVDVMNDIMGTKLNWAPLVKGWLTPTGETQDDKRYAALINLLDATDVETVTMPCGHRIPTAVFHLERYNGCPLCGRQFSTSTFVYRGQGCKLRELDLWTDAEMQAHLSRLLASPTPLDATQSESLKTLLRHYGLPDGAAIGCKETLMMAVDTLVEAGEGREAQLLLKTPVDIMRYLWYRQTGQLQIIEPRTLIATAQRNGRHMTPTEDRSAGAAADMRTRLRLHYDRRWCRMVAEWMNALPMSPQQVCEAMHPKREMWVRFIRALRLAEYARRKGFDRLAEVLDRFYNKRYTVFGGRLETARLKKDSATAFALLKQRPGLFARSLFASMLWFGPDVALPAFREVAGRVPLRLLFTLAMYAPDYFNPDHKRVVSPLGGGRKAIPANPLTQRYSTEALRAMAGAVGQLAEDMLRRHYGEGTELKGKRVVIDPQLYNIPLSIGERAKTVQDASCALQGTVFPVSGDEVRLFLQWGKGLPAQHLDMDLSCVMITPDDAYECSYYNLSVPGAQHSGDIRQIPDQVGTAEYIELDLKALRERGVSYAVFTCNAYTAGSLAPNLVVGWMNTAAPMKVSEATGVAYDPSTVQHMVRVDDSNLTKGLVFGVLRVETHDILWLEMPFGGQLGRNMNFATLTALIAKLQSRISIGRALELKATAQGATLVPADAAPTAAGTATAATSGAVAPASSAVVAPAASDVSSPASGTAATSGVVAPAADVVFDYAWALDSAKVSQYLLG